MKSPVLLALGLLSGITNAANPSEPVPKFDLPEPPGPFSVKHDTFEVVDKSRLDPFNATHFRRLMVSRFDPVKDCEICHVPYMPPATAKLEHEVLSTIGQLPRVLEVATLPVCCDSGGGGDGDKTQGDLDSEFPLLVFSGGYNTTRLLYSALAQAVASAGYTVLTVDHPYETAIVEFPDGSIITGGRIANPGIDPTGGTWALDVRAADISFLVNGFSRDRPAGVFGHSLGGAAAATTIAKDVSVAGGINLDGIQLGRVVEDGFGSDRVRQAFALFGSEGHDTTTDTSWGKFWNKMHEPPHDKVWTRELTMHPSKHGSYWDLRLLLDASGAWDQMDKLMREELAGPMPGKRVMEVIHAYVGSFFGFVLKEKDDELFNGQSEAFPEVEIRPYDG